MALRDGRLIGELLGEAGGEPARGAAGLDPPQIAGGDQMDDPPGLTIIERISPNFRSERRALAPWGFLRTT